MKKNTHKIVISQGTRKANFHFNDKEMAALRTYSEGRTTTMGRCYNFSMYAFFENKTTSYKHGRFLKLFDYNGGDFFWYEE